jgi:hypothetical protein
MTHRHWRLRVGTVGLAILLLGSAVRAVEADDGRTPTASPQAAAARPSDVESLDAIIGSLYDVISGPAKAPRDWDRFRSLFAPGARLMPINRRPGIPAEARVLSPDDYVERTSKVFEQTGFFEAEVARRVETFAGLTHVWSTYESRRAADDQTPFARGINSIQLLNDGTRWWIVTVFWESERPDQPIPQMYLPR